LYCDRLQFRESAASAGIGDHVELDENTATAAAMTIAT
jgi:hypothetical protein